MNAWSLWGWESSTESMGGRGERMGKQHTWARARKHMHLDGVLRIKEKVVPLMKAGEGYRSSNQKDGKEALLRGRDKTRTSNKEQTNE